MLSVKEKGYNKFDRVTTLLTNHITTKGKRLLENAIHQNIGNQVETKTGPV